MRYAWTFLLILVFGPPGLAETAKSGQGPRFLEEVQVEGPSPHSRYYRQWRLRAQGPTEAQGRELEVFEQPRARKWGLSIAPLMKRSSEGTGRLFATALKIGVTDSLALGVADSYGAVQTHDSRTIGGWADLELSAQARHRLSSIDALYLKIVYSRSFAPQRQAGRDDSGGAVDGNRMSGGDSVAPAIGYQHDLQGRFSLGLAFAHIVKRTRRLVMAEDASREWSLSGGNSTEGSLTFEKSLAKNTVGASLRHSWIAASELTAPENQRIENKERSGIWGATLYAVVASGERVAFVPSFTAAEFSELKLAARLIL